MRPLSPWRLLAAAFLALAAQPAAARNSASYTQLIVFGDSLSDVGNNGRFSAGYLWDEHLAGAAGQVLTASNDGGTDYAMSGALITSDNGNIASLPHQVAAYLNAHHKADPNALYAIWGGGNDVFSTIGNGSAGAGIEKAGVSDTLAMIKSLYAAGARAFLICNVPRTDLTPRVQALDNATIAQQAALVVDWNGQLRQALDGLKLGGARILRYDAAAALLAVVTSPTHFGFTDYTHACDNTCRDPDHTFFWDDIHPGATGHVLIGGATLALVTQ